MKASAITLELLTPQIESFQALSYEDRPTTVPVHSQYNDFNVINVSKH